MSADNNEEITNIILKSILFIIFIPALFSHVLIKNVVKNNSYILKKYDKAKRLYICLITIAVSIVLVIIVVLAANNVNKLIYIYLAVPIFAVISSLLFLWAEIFYKSVIDYRITNEHLNQERLDFSNFDELLLDKNQIPIGMSLTTHKPITIASYKRCRHQMITGSPGHGKTSLAITMLKHDLFWNRPVFFIDPKGDKEDFQTIKEYCELYNRQEDLLVYSLGVKGSEVYDPLLIGNPRVKAEKIVYALGLNHEHYGQLALSFLDIVFSIYELQSKRCTLNELEGILLSKERLQALFADVPSILAKFDKDKKYNNLIYKVSRFKSIKPEDLIGLQSGISGLNDFSVSSKINPSPDTTEIDIREAIRSKKVIIFDIKSGEYTGLARTIGRFILKDFEIITSELQDGLIKHDNDFIPIYFDEFDSFANKEFHEFIKKARSAKISLNFMFQTVEGITGIDETLLGKITTLADTGLHFRARSKPDVDFVVNHCGSVERKEQSSQVNKKAILNQSTGMGTEVSIETFKINPNLYRDLKEGQCVIAGDIVDLVQIWHSKAVLKRSKSKAELLQCKSDHSKKQPKMYEIDSKSANILATLPTERVLYYSYHEIETAISQINPI